jgi:cytochrome c biogenesis protein CcdA
MRVFNIAIGIFSIILGLLALYDYLVYKKTRNTDLLLLQLPLAIKNRIHQLIGLYYRQRPTPRENTPSCRPLFKLISSALITGFLVSLLEAVCTGQTYLPTIVFVLKTTSLKLQALVYLFIYNLMFILPLVVIFLVALCGVSSGELSRFLRRHIPKIKIFMAIIFLALGVFLLWRV